ncbi:hypothetical protein [Phytopseudomonas daroniae]|uniref:hypothetical protein n=1 Tax=Pseudomonadaceae TaxID=135621 RepID=UPI0010376255|nr:MULTISPECIES: hypothetical protein [Pseudomonas]
MATQVWQLEKVADYSGHAAPRTAAPGRRLFRAASCKLQATSFKLKVNRRSSSFWLEANCYDLPRFAT